MAGNPWEAHADVLSIDDALAAGRTTLDGAREEYNNALCKGTETYEDCVKAREEAEQAEKDAKYQLEKEEQEIADLWKQIEASEEKIASAQEDGDKDGANSEKAWMDSLYADVARHEDKRKELSNIHASAEENLKGCQEDEKEAESALEELRIGVAERLKQIEEIEEKNQAELSKAGNAIRSK